MRKLTYDIYTKNAFVKNVSSYAEMQEAKEKGYTVKEKLVDMDEVLFFDILDKEKKIVKVVSLLEEMEEAVANGYTAEPRLAWVER